jgi:hypothetical protein
MKPMPLVLSFLFSIIHVSVFAQGVTWQYFYMLGNDCQVFTTTGNSRIKVPANCFLLNGKPYQGEVMIAFKEYKDQVDFILGNLNLRYQVNGKSATLQSGGMFEFLATTNTQPALPLTFATPKKVTIKFAVDSRFNVPGLEPYFFDSNSGNWVKNTRYGQSFNRRVTDDPSSLWQEEVILPPSNRDPEMDGDLLDCYTIQIIDRNDPFKMIDSLICTQNNPLDNRYDNYLSKEAYKTMQIDQMGLYNYDKIFDEENTIPMFVNLITKDGKPFELTNKLYVVYKTTNTVIYYTQAELADKFSLLPRTDIKIFCYGEDGSISKVPDSFWKGFDAKKYRGKTLELPFESLNLARLTKAEFAKFTGL